MNKQNNRNFRNLRYSHYIQVDFIKNIDILKYILNTVKIIADNID